VIDGIPVHPFAPYKLFFLVTQAPIPKLQIQVFAESCQYHSSNFMAPVGGRGAQETPGAAFFSNEFKGHGDLLQHRAH
jgi:hypothetical protein